MKARIRDALARFLNVAVALDLATIIISSVILIRYLSSTPPTDKDIPEILLAILSVLLLITLSGTWERVKRLYQIQKTVKGIYQAILDSRIYQMGGADAFFESTAEPNEEFFSTATEIRISGITLSSTMNRFRSVLRERLEAGANIRIILLDYESDEVLSQIVRRSWSDVATKEYYEGLLTSTAQLIENIGNAKNAKGILEIGLLPFVPSFGIQMIDPEDKSGAAFIEIYHHNSVKPSPKFPVLINKDPNTFQFFSEQFELMWKECKTKVVV